MTKTFDVVVAILPLLFLIPFLAIIVAVKSSSKGPVFYWSKGLDKIVNISSAKI